VEGAPRILDDANVGAKIRESRGLAAIKRADLRATASDVR
jgi:hypothetical protein